MADSKMTLRRKCRPSYDLLNKLSTWDIYVDESKKKKIKSCGIFEAERLIAMRRNQNLKANEYLVLWKGFSNFETTWEPEEHLSSASLKYFNNQVPSMEILQENFDLLRTGIIEGLKSKITSQTLAINCRHDVFKYIFKGKGINAVEKNWQLFEKADFDKCRFPQDWDIVLDGSGDGSKIKFPVKMRCFLSWSQKYYTVKDKDLVEAPRSFLEKVSIKFVKLPHTINTT